MNAPSSPRIRIVMLAMAAINAAGVSGLGWMVQSMLRHDVVMPSELALYIVPALLLVALTWGGFALARRGRAKTALTLLAIGAIPTAAAFGFLAYLDANPIDWR